MAVRNKKKVQWDVLQNVETNALFKKYPGKRTLIKFNCPITAHAMSYAAQLLAHNAYTVH